MARYGMLQCGRNFSAKTGKNCHTCNVIDDEEHRLNICPKWMTDNNDTQAEILAKQRQFEKIRLTLHVLIFKFTDQAIS